jgi:transcriptional regulator with XRE-family HTH domain
MPSAHPSDQEYAVAPEETLSAKVTNAASEVASDIGSFIRSQRELAQVSVRQLAEKSGVSNPYLSQVERGLRKPSADVLNQIAKALRVSAEVLYVRAGILEPSDKSQVQDAIITDTAITERQKQILLDIYASFAQQNETIHEECSTESESESDI